jgi:hypothetical protein
MANQVGARPRNRQSASSRTTSRVSGNSTSGSRSRVNSRRQPPLFFQLLASVFVFFRYNAFGRLLLAVLLAALVVSLQMLAFRSNVQLFFRLIGLEWLTLLGTGWVWYMMDGLARQEQS